MKHFRILCLVLIVLSCFSAVPAQAPEKSGQSDSRAHLYAVLYHQHHNFFQKAFSYQGLELGVLLHNNLFLGAYGSLFVSNLKIVQDNHVQFVWMGQAGASASYILFDKKRIHPGCELKAGVFVLRKDAQNFGLFKTGNAAYHLNGLATSPQLFAEIRATRRSRIRLGLAYNFYNFQDHTMVQTSDLNHISFTFGLVFHGKIR